MDLLTIITDDVNFPTKIYPNESRPMEKGLLVMPECVLILSLPLETQFANGVVVIINLKKDKVTVYQRLQQRMSENFPPWIPMVVEKKLVKNHTLWNILIGGTWTVYSGCELWVPWDGIVSPQCYVREFYTVAEVWPLFF